MIDPKNTHIYKNKHYYRETHMYNMFVIVDLLYGTFYEKKKRMIAHQYYNKTTSVKVEDIRTCIESC
jgi:hypothetical protein